MKEKNKTEKLVEVYVDLPNHWAIDGETMWGLPLGNDIYVLKSIPCYSYDLNRGDCVVASPEPDGSIRNIRKVHGRSGNRTLRVLFAEKVPAKDMAKFIASFKGYGAESVQVNERFFSVDIPPTGDYDSLYLLLEEWETKGDIQYETCEAREEGSFDDLPARGETG
ncbi:MAG: DUF4265 domain-containing protein [Proteobacteria bacterium]|nr:DUF4265 domain-containing protein [Pseudomonadota bacterium]